MQFHFIDMEDYSIEQKMYLVSWAIAYNNREESRRLFRQKYQKEPPASCVIRYWSLKFLETGNLMSDRQRSGRPRSASSEDNKENVFRYIEEDRTLSVRDI